MDFIDLHIHTNASDGTDSPARVVEKARELGLAAIAITDHDTIAGVEEAQARGRELGVEVVSGVELAVDYYGRELHLLGYFVPKNAPGLERLLAEAACRRWNTTPETLLRKTGDNPPQSGLSDGAARRANVLGMYEPVGDAAGKHILLVDDIVTTGATLCECARTLRLAGAASVVCVTVCRTRRK